MNLLGRLAQGGDSAGRFVDRLGDAAHAVHHAENYLAAVAGQLLGLGRNGLGVARMVGDLGDVLDHLLHGCGHVGGVVRLLA
ncbi:hypothetical protein D3C77_733610 [compost metagenome]